MSKDNTCKWILPEVIYTEDFDEVWETSCHHFYIFLDGGPKENDFVYCPFCGKRMVAIREYER